MKRNLLLAFFAILTFAAFAQVQEHPPRECEPGMGHANSNQHNYAALAAQQAESAQKVDYTIYPNPVSDYFSLDQESVEKGVANVINLYNLLGQRVRTFQVDKEQRYNVSDLQGGLYLVQLLDDKGKIITTRRLQKASNFVRP